MKIYKYPIPMPDKEGISVVAMPKEAEILSVGIQNDELVLWAKMPRYVSLDSRRPLVVVNTGVQFPSSTNGRFIGTVTSSNGIVWHVLEF